MSELSAMYREFMGPIGDRMVSLVDSLIPIETMPLTKGRPQKVSAASHMKCQGGVKARPSDSVESGGRQPGASRTF